jgi:hypothetical protein
VCNAGVVNEAGLLENVKTASERPVFMSMLLFVLLLGLLVVSNVVKRSRAKARGYVRLEGDQVSRILDVFSNSLPNSHRI